MKVIIQNKFEGRTLSNVDYTIVSKNIIEVYYLDNTRESFERDSFTQVIYKED